MNLETCTWLLKAALTIFQRQATSDHGDNMTLNGNAAARSMKYHEKKHRMIYHLIIRRSALCVLSLSCVMLLLLQSATFYLTEVVEESSSRIGVVYAPFVRNGDAHPTGIDRSDDSSSSTESFPKQTEEAGAPQAAHRIIRYPAALECRLADEREETSICLSNAMDHSKRQVT